VDEEDRRPYHLQSVASSIHRRLLLLAVEEGGQRVDRQGITAYVGDPHDNPQPS